MSELMKRLKLQYYRESGGGAYRDKTLYGEAYDYIAELEQQVAALRAGIQEVIDGGARTTLKYEQCSHGKYGYEECENCIDDYLERLIAQPTGQDKG